MSACPGERPLSLSKTSCSTCLLYTSVRSTLGTGVEADGTVDSTPAGTNVDGKAKVVQDATLEVDGKTYTIRELASQEMKNSAGATWDAATAGNAIGIWTASFGDQIDVVVSNNDGMGMSMFNAWAKDNKVPTFGYDANSDAVAAIGEGYGGTISQHADVQAYLTLRVLRNALDGVDIDTGICLLYTSNGFLGNTFTERIIWVDL